MHGLIRERVCLPEVRYGAYQWEVRICIYLQPISSRAFGLRTTGFRSWDRIRPIGKSCSVDILCALFLWAGRLGIFVVAGM